jgi:arginase
MRQLMFSPDRYNGSRRSFLLGATAVAAMARLAPARAHEKATHLVLAPSNLGLHPEEGGVEPGTWRAPEVLMAAGLEKRVAAEEVVRLPRPSYDTRAQAGTRIRNGNSLRRFSLDLAAAVHKVMAQGAFPLVVGGDCSVLLGSLYGACLAGARGLIHIDGHSDFTHPGNYDTRSRLGSAAGMDLALVTGRGEPLLTRWPDIDGPLVRDEDAIQLGERNALSEGFRASYGDIERTAITRYIIQDVLEAGIEHIALSVIERLRARGLDRVWLHVDLDVLDQSVMPAVDSPGSPGLTFAQLRSLLARLYRSGRVAGGTTTIYDPARDPENRYAAPIVVTLGEAFTWSGNDDSTDST